MNDLPQTITRRVLGLASVVTAAFGRQLAAQPAPRPPTTSPEAAVRETSVRFTVNDEARELSLDPRTTLLDALRDHLGLTGTKKGCDHGQCGACTVLVNGRRVNACLNLAVARAGDRIVTIEGLAEDGKLHPLQDAFVKHDGFQCGFCTPGQICSAVGMLAEAKAGMPSAVTGDLRGRVEVDAVEVRERMSGNICRCSAYPNIVAAILDAKGAAT